MLEVVKFKAFLKSSNMHNDIVLEISENANTLIPKQLMASKKNIGINFFGFLKKTWFQFNNN